MTAVSPIENFAESIYVGRQPIYDRDLNVVAYELLYRDGAEINRADVVNGEHATTHVLNNAFMEIGFDELVGDCKAFINMPRGYITSDQLLSLPPERVVLELLETIEIDDEVIDSVKRLSQKGYTIALDDFVFHEKLTPLVQISDIIKIDLMLMDNESLLQHVKFLKQYNLRLLAEKVETQEQFELCKQLGFDYYQGYFFCRPQIIRGGKLPSNRLSILQLISRIYQPEVSFRELEALISQDVTLSYKLLRVINSAAYSLPRKVESMKQAVTILGVKNLRNWISMISFSGIGDKPGELIRNAMIRAKMCERLASAEGVDDVDSYFTVGMFSNLDAILDQSLEALIEPLPLSVEIKQALLSHTGVLGKALSCVLAYERGDWERVMFGNLSPKQIRQSYATALHWANELSREVI